MKTKLSEAETDTSFSVFHNNVVHLNRNPENLQTHILHSFECVPTPLSSGDVGLFIDESLNYRILEKISNEAFQAL